VSQHASARVTEGKVEESQKLVADANSKVQQLEKAGPFGRCGGHVGAYPNLWRLESHHPG